MRLKVQFISSRPIILPAGFNEYVQGLIYSHLNPEGAGWLHDQGFKYEKRSFKLFTFSDMIETGSFNRETRAFTFPQNISFYISSPVDWILEHLANNLIKSETVRLGENSLRVSGIEISKPPPIDRDEIKVKTLAPIETHSTFTPGSGSKKTYYYTPFEKEFSKLINENLRKKWEAFYNEACSHNMNITPLFHGRNNEKVRTFAGTVVKGWTGHFKLKGNTDLLYFACEAGLGSRNSQGFGMVEAMGPNTRGESNG